jgi:hypothetical protein
MRNYKAMIEKIDRQASEAVDLVLKQIQDEVIVPFCQKYRIKFWSGMGGYNFITRGGKNLLDSSVCNNLSGNGYHTEIIVVRRYRKTQCGKELAEIIKVLELMGTESHPNEVCPLGAYLEDYSVKQEE